mmetsp:Transcript_87982/g.246158  ORF Transcript_87982/g.246158 Transcript_87982/m.246158 type:complete len:315 (+) Transcript_87982:240-1184(+)
MKSFGLQSLCLEVARSSYLTALLSCGCRNVRALNVVSHLLVSSPAHVCRKGPSPLCKSNKNSSTCFVLPFGSLCWCVFASSPMTMGSPAAPAAFRTAFTTGVEARPAVSPWKEARTTFCCASPKRREAQNAQRSPSAVGTSVERNSPRSSSCTLPAKRACATRIREFWFRTKSIAEGTSNANRWASVGWASNAFRKSPATSCRKTMSASANDACSARKLRTFACLLTTSASQNFSLSSCQFSDSGAQIFITWTRIASKMARASVCRGMEIASSSAVMAGYLLRLMGCSRAQTFLDSSPCLLFMHTSLQNMNSNH